MGYLIRRHIRYYLRDRWAVFFSFLSIIIVLVLFVLFLGTMHEGSVDESVRGTDEATYLIYSWVFSGILMISTVTVALGFLGMMVRDTETKSINDFYVTPLRRSTIVLSYLGGAAVITFILSAFNLALGQAIIYINAGHRLPFFDLIRVLLVMLLSTLLFTSLFFFIVSHLRTSNAHGTLSTLVGTLIGFLGGIYVPIGALGSTTRTILNLLPPMQVSALFRQTYMFEPMGLVFPTTASAESYRLFYGIDIELFGATLPPLSLTAILVFWTVLFFVLSFMRLKTFKVK